MESFDARKKWFNSGGDPDQDADRRCLDGGLCSPSPPELAEVEKDSTFLPLTKYDLILG